MMTRGTGRQPLPYEQPQPAAGYAAKDRNRTTRGRQTTSSPSNKAGGPAPSPPLTDRATQHGGTATPTP